MAEAENPEDSWFTPKGEPISESTLDPDEDEEQEDDA